MGLLYIGTALTAWSLKPTSSVFPAQSKLNLYTKLSSSKGQLGLIFLHIGIAYLIGNQIQITSLFSDISHNLKSPVGMSE
jgi:hypothetical protein